MPRVVFISASAGLCINMQGSLQPSWDWQSDNDTYFTHINFYLSMLDPFYQGKSNHNSVSLLMLKVCNDYQIGGHCHRFRSAGLSSYSLSSEITAHLSKQTWCWCCENTPPPPNRISPVCHLIRFNPHLDPHYLLLNHLITPSSISLHNWMKRRNRSVTLECFRDLYFLLNICVQSASGKRKHQHLCWLSWDWIHSQNKEETERKGDWDQRRAVCINKFFWLVHLVKSKLFS